MILLPEPGVSTSSKADKNRTENTSHHALQNKKNLHCVKVNGNTSHPPFPLSDKWALN